MPTSLARLPLACLLLSAPAVLAADAKPIAHVGVEAISADDLVRRLAKIPPFQREAMADNSAALKRQVLGAQLVPELLYGQEAQRLKLAERPGTRDRVREALRQAMDRELKQRTAQSSPVTQKDIGDYFEANRGRFETPRRVRIWRILSDDETLVKRIISESKGVDGLQRWSTFARENSLDTATHLRNGDLGFVRADGNTDTPTLRVDPVLFAAAERLADGELGLEPIKEGLHWAAIWRRGSMPAVTRTLAQEEGSIRQVLERQRVEIARERLLTTLRAQYVTVDNAALLEGLNFDSEGLPTRERIARDPHPAAAGSSVPQLGERDVR